jgi:hypothetical protein
VNIEGMSFSCKSCGTEVELPPEEPPCRRLKGWLIVAHWKGAASVEHNHFCSLDCLQKWADSQVTNIPEVFMRYFTENGDES